MRAGGGDTRGRARPLGHNGQIAFGRYDPFFDDTVPYTINPDGTHEQRAIDIPGEFPDWSPDGTLLSSCCSPVGDSHSAATIVNPDDPGGYVALPQPDPANLDLYCGPWSADGARLACEGYGTSDDSRNGIYTIRFSDGGGQRRMTSNPAAATNRVTTRPTASASSTRTSRPSRRISNATPV